MGYFPVGSPFESLNDKNYQAGWIKFLQDGKLDDFVEDKIGEPQIFSVPSEGYTLVRNTELLDIVGPGEQLSEMIIYNVGIGDVLITIGTYPCTADLYEGIIPAGEAETFEWHKIFSISSPTSIYISSYNWNNSILKTVVQTEPLFIF